MINVFIDFETYSPYDIKKVGIARYFTDHEPLIMGVNGKTISILECPIYGYSEMQKVCKGYVAQKNIVFVAHNAQFEKYVMESLLGCSIAPSRFICTQALCAYLGLPLGLEKANDYLGLAPKDTEGKRLMKKFSFPRKPTKKDPRTRIFPHEEPEEFKKYEQYCAQDTIADMELFECLKERL